MIVKCISCQATYDDEFRWTICPHETFAANDGHNYFEHHPESFFAPPPHPAEHAIDVAIHRFIFDRDNESQFWLSHFNKAIDILESEEFSKELTTTK